MDRFGERRGSSPEELEIARVLDQAHEKAQAMLHAKAVDMKAFRDIYGEAEVANDEARIVDYEKKFSEADATEKKQRDKKLATVVEAVFYDQASRNGWLGPEAQVLRSSKYDDYVNGVDCITEYRRGNTAAYLAMAIDATWSSHPGSKFDKIRNELDRGRLGKIKYLEADGKPQRGREVPRVVVGASEKTLQKVIALWTEGNDEALKDHPIQILFLEEIVDQLEGFRTFSQRKKHGNNVAVFDEYLKILKPILEEKRRTIGATERFDNDIVKNGIKASLFGLNYVPPAAAA